MTAAEAFLAAMEKASAELDDMRAQRDAALNRAEVARIHETKENIRAEVLAERLRALEGCCRGCRRNPCGCPANRVIAQGTGDTERAETFTVLVDPEALRKWEPHVFFIPEDHDDDDESEV